MLPNNEPFADVAISTNTGSITDTFGNLTSTRSDWIGKTVLGYKICAYAGSGSYGTVWVGQNPMGESHAIKIIENGSFGSEELANQELRGIRLLKEMLPSHPNLIGIHEWDDSPQQLIYSMDLADTVPSRKDDPNHYLPDTLAHRIQYKGRLSFAETQEIVQGLIEGLKSLHANGLVHRDLKPQNIVFVKQIPKLADTGLITFDSSTIGVAGTMGYLPLDGTIGPEADLYALGKITYQCVTGLGVEEFPSIPNDLLKSPEQLQVFFLINRFWNKACSLNQKNRYQNIFDFERAFQKAFSPLNRKRSKIIDWFIFVGILVLIFLLLLLI
ncbi:MAG: protein kinase [Gemmataceae bacterium]|jgi:serine/threonine protein kinase|nr:protein kinase [Gemmataceae bacterium]